MNIDSDIFKIQSNNVLPSRGKILISEPFLRDATFGRSVVLLIDHTEEGSMGLIINKQLPIFVNDIIKEFKYIENIPLYKGGPIATDTLFYLHTLADIPGAIPISKGLYLNGDFDEIKKYILQGKQSRPLHPLLPGILRLGKRTTEHRTQREHMARLQRRECLSDERRHQGYVETSLGETRQQV